MRANLKIEPQELEQAINRAQLSTTLHPVLCHEVHIIPYETYVTVEGPHTAIQKLLDVLPGSTCFAVIK